VKRLGKNHGGYFGERIDTHALLRDATAAARQHGWASEIFHEAGEFKWFAFHRPAFSAINAQPTSRIYISAGIHGDEPASPLAALKLLQENIWPEHAEIFLLPCLNPIGFTRNTREDDGGRDLNRDYRHPQAASTCAHIAWLKRQPKFDLHLCLHEDWEASGFYLYEQNPGGKPSRAELMIEAVKAVCPIDPAEIIEGREARNGIIRPNIPPSERPQWPEAVWLIVQKTRLGYTLEAPSDFELAVRTQALVRAARAAIQH
jgi:hypothetical protein